MAAQKLREKDSRASGSCTKKRQERIKVPRCRFGGASRGAVPVVLVRLRENARVKGGKERCACFECVRAPHLKKRLGDKPGEGNGGLEPCGALQSGLSCGLWCAAVATASGV